MSLSLLLNHSIQVHIMQIELAQQSHKNPHKNLNGDFCAYQMLTEEKLVVLVLADGVGNSPCDWKASKISCEFFIRAFTASSEQDITNRFSQSLQETNQELLLESGSCAEMKSTFCGVIWDQASENIYYVNIGDSRIYRWQANELEQISTDEVKSVILTKMDGKPIVVAGVIAVADGVTNVLGSPELDFKVKTIDADNTSGIVLTTDGFHGASRYFAKDMLRTINAVNLENSLAQLHQKYKDRQKDDMTALVIRKMHNVSNQALIQAIITNKDISNVSKLELTKAVIQGLAAGIKNKNNSETMALISQCNDRSIDLGRATIGELISLIINVDFQDGEVYQQLLKLMRNSKG